VNVEPNIERAVRNALAGAVAQEPEKFEDALNGLTSHGEEFAQKSLSLGLAICYAALLEVHEGGSPDDEQIDYLAGALVESEAWAEIDRASALKFFASVANRTPINENIPLGDAYEMVFIAGAWLLSSFPPEDRPWTTFLDLILDGLESDSVGS
jgi:hypothetical protein